MVAVAQAIWMAELWMAWRELVHRDRPDLQHGRKNAKKRREQASSEEDEEQRFLGFVRKECRKAMLQLRLPNAAK